MASIVLLLSELLGGESASVVAAERYMGGHRSLGEFRPSVTVMSEAPPPAKHEQGQRRLVVEDDRHAAAGTTMRARDDKKREESFDDLAVSRITVDIMWP